MPVPKGVRNDKQEQEQMVAGMSVSEKYRGIKSDGIPSGGTDFQQAFNMWHNLLRLILTNFSHFT